MLHVSFVAPPAAISLVLRPHVFWWFSSSELHATLRTAANTRTHPIGRPKELLHLDDSRVFRH